MKKNKLVITHVGQGTTLGLGAARLDGWDGNRYWEVALGNFEPGGTIVIPVTGKSKRLAGKITFTFSHNGVVEVDVMTYAEKKRKESSDD